MSSLFADHFLSIMILVPLLGIAFVGLTRDEEWLRRITLGTTLVELGLGFILWARFDFTNTELQYVERLQWMPTFNIQYAVGVDGISLLLVVLTTLLCPLCVLCSWKSIHSRVKPFMMLILLVESAMIVVFCALDLFLFFMLWEVTMIPMYFMIALWGGPNRIGAAIQIRLVQLDGKFVVACGNSWTLPGRRTHV